MNKDTAVRLLVVVAVAAAVVIGTIAITQQVRVGCVDLGFWKSCGMSVTPKV